MLKEFRENLISQQRSKNTIQAYLKAAEQYLRWYKESFLSEFVLFLPNNIAEFVSYLSNIRKLDAGSINLKLCGLRQFEKFLIQKGIQSELVISDSYNKKIQTPYINPCKTTQKEVDAFRQQILLHNGNRDFAIATIMAYAGLRVSEVTHLLLTDINLTTREILVIGKGDKKRVVDIGDKVVHAVRQYLKERQDICDYLFISRRKGKLDRSSINRIFSKYSEKITPHELRHFFCSNALEKGYSLIEVAYQAGHSSIQTTQRYTNPDKRKMQEKANLL